MNHLKITMASILTVSVAADCFGQPRNFCFAFLLRGDVTVACDGSTSQITHQADIESFAVSDEEASFAHTTSRTVKRTGAVESAVSTTTLVDLRTHTSRRFEGVAGIVGTCGGLFPADGTKMRFTARDLVTGAEIAIQPYVRFRCSSDRATVIGTTADGANGLYEGLPPAVKIAEPDTFNIHGFGISPDGSKITYRDDHDRLCVVSAPGQMHCIEKQGTLADIPTVDNRGEALVAAGTGQECFYDGSYKFSPQRFPGATDENRDECLGIGYWKPGLRSVQIIVPLGRSPQWISPVTAEMLRMWSLSQQTRTSPK